MNLLEVRLAYDEKDKVRELFREYVNMLMDMDTDSSLKKYLKLQDYSAEFDDPGKKYGMPKGRLYTAYYDRQLAGCVALRPIDALVCEMKRLFVRPSFRGKKIGKELVELIILEAREIGYKHMVLDTLPDLKNALGLYDKTGFYEIKCYNDNPVEGSVFLQKDL